MKINWKTIITGITIISGLLSYLIFENWMICLLIASVILLLLFLIIKKKRKEKKKISMKRFVDENGIFDVHVPSTWKYSLKNEKVHTFQEYEIWKHDAFQISIQPHNEEANKRFQQICKGLESTEINGTLFYQYPESGGDGFTTKSWTNLINDRVVLFTFTHSISPDEELDPKSIEEKLNEVKEIITSFKLIPTEDSEATLNSYRFEMFLKGVGATSYMLNKAVGNQAFIEATCLLASQIDGLLRTGIVLQNQINNNNSEIEKEWIYQGLTDRKKSEKDVYKKAKELGIINKDIFDELYKLYDDRNRVIHRFVISEITLAEVENISYTYYQMQQKINAIVYKIESKQIELGVGMTRSGTADDTEHIEYIKGKIGKQNYFEEKE
jgi:hypothetical protein